MSSSIPRISEVNDDLASLEGSQTTAASNMEGPRTTEEADVIAKEESKSVFRLKLLVITVLLVSAIGALPG
jgi:hypothetical protein